MPNPLAFENGSRNLIPFTASQTLRCLRKKWLISIRQNSGHNTCNNRKAQWWKPFIINGLKATCKASFFGHFKYQYLNLYPCDLVSLVKHLLLALLSSISAPLWPVCLNQCYQNWPVWSVGGKNLFGPVNESVVGRFNTEPAGFVQCYQGPVEHIFFLE